MGILPCLPWSFAMVHAGPAVILAARVVGLILQRKLR
jgi:hypothetical protein